MVNPAGESNNGVLRLDFDRKLTPLGTGHSVLRLSRRGAPDHLHYERHRGAERKTAPRRENERAFSDRRSRNEIALSRLAPGCGKMENRLQRQNGDHPLSQALRRL